MKRSLILSSLTLVLHGMFGSAVGADGNNYYVDNLTQCAGLVPCYRTIMDAVDAAVPSSTIEVFPGVYREEVVFNNTAGIVLRGHDAAAMPVIVAPPGGSSAVTVHATPGIHILGFILEAPAAAGVVAMNAGSGGTVIEGNLIRSRDGITLYDTGLVIRNNTIEGGGIRANGGRSNLIEGNAIEGAVVIDEFNVNPTANVIRNNFVRGSIDIRGGLPDGLVGAEGNIVESNLVVDGSIRLVPFLGNDNLIRDNVVRGGGIEVGHGALLNTIEGNFVSGSPRDGILANSYGDDGDANRGGGNLVRGNTSVENAGCDLNDISDPGTSFANLWSENRSITNCGSVQECPSPADWYRDGDGDGYGTLDDRQAACDRPAGFASAPGDCDDANPSLHPGAGESCDGLDGDCNGVVDDDPSATAFCDDGNDCTIDACQAGACGHSPAILPQATCTASPQVLNLGSNGKPFGLILTLTDRCSGQALDPTRLTPVFVSSVASPALGQAILTTPDSAPGCTEDGIWETVPRRGLLYAGTMRTHFLAPSDGLCTTLDGNRQDIMRLLGNARDGETADISFAAGYPGAAVSMHCVASVVVRRGAVNQAGGTARRR